MSEAKAILSRLLTPLLAWNMAQEPGRPKRKAEDATRTAAEAVRRAAADLLAEAEKP